MGSRGLPLSRQHPGWLEAVWGKPRSLSRLQGAKLNGRSWWVGRGAVWSLKQSGHSLVTSSPGREEERGFPDLDSNPPGKQAPEEGRNSISLLIPSIWWCAQMGGGAVSAGTRQCLKMGFLCAEILHIVHCLLLPLQGSPSHAWLVHNYIEAPEGAGGSWG